MIRLLVLAFSLFAALPSFAQTYETLTMVRPVATGAAGTGLDANNRVYRAYTGISYTIRATARGGKWPYSYELVSGVPTGMTIEAGPCTANGVSCTAGTITWSSPTAGTHADITVRITDSLGAQVTGVWTLVVSTTACSNAGGFCFVDATNGNDANNGDFATPYQTLTGLKAARTGHQIVYARTGTYLLNQAAATWTWREDVSGPVIWLCYPGDTCTIDWQSDGGAEVTHLRFQGKNIYVDGFRKANVGSMGIQVVQDARYGGVFRNMRGLQLVDGENGQNSAFIMWVNANPGSPSYWNTVQNSIFSDMHGDGGIDNGDGGATDDAACAIKMYNMKDSIIEDNEFNGLPFSEGAIAPKEEVPGTTIRNNKSASDVQTLVHGNFNNQGGTYEAASGEILHNLCLAATTDCIDISTAKIGNIGAWQIYRNTFIGLAHMANVATADGPYTFHDNVILNAGGTGGSCPGRLTCTSVTDYTRIVLDADNVQGANDGSIANATTGLLVGQSRTDYLGIAGFELTATAAGRRFSPTLNLRRF